MSFFSHMGLKWVFMLLKLCWMQNTWSPCRSCHPRWSFHIVAVILACRSEIKHIPRLSFTTCLRRRCKNQDQESSFSLSTRAKTMRITFLLPSCVLAISNVPLYRPYKNVPSTWTIGFAFVSAAMHGLKVQNKRWNITVGPSVMLVSGHSLFIN